MKKHAQMVLQSGFKSGATHRSPIQALQTLDVKETIVQEEFSARTFFNRCC